MTEQAKKRIQDAIAKYEKKIAPKQSTGRKNKKPEKELEKIVMLWLKQNGFIVNVVESKAVYNPYAKRYLRGQTQAGFADIVGVTPSGHGCFIELKAPGRLSTLRDHQKAFLEARRACGAFAVAIDSIELLQKLYAAWLQENSAKK